MGLFVDEIISVSYLVTSIFLIGNIFGNFKIDVKALFFCMSMAIVFLCQLGFCFTRT